MILLPRRNLPSITARVHVDGGHLRETQAGAAVLTGACMDEGAGGRAGDEISRFVESRGAKFSAGAGGAVLRSLTEHFEACLDVARDVLVHPDFPQDAIERKRGQLLTQLL